MIRPTTRRFTPLALLALLAAATPPAARADDLVRLSRNLPGESRPLQIDADEITTWVDGDTRVLLLRGQVLAQQGVVRARFQEGVLLIDLRRYQATHVWDVDVYAEGDVSVQNGPDVTVGPAGFLDLHTRGELKLNAHKSKVKQEARPAEAVYRRALARQAALRGDAPRLVADARPADAPIERVSFDEPTAPPPLPRPSTQPVQGAPPAEPPPLPVPPLTPETSPSAQPPPLPTVPNSRPAPAPGVSRPQGPLANPFGGSSPGGPPVAREYTIVPRNPSGFQTDIRTDPRTGERIVVAVGGFLVNVRAGNADVLDIEADKLVLWTTGNPQELVDNLRTSQGAQGNRELELYLAGNVEIRSHAGKQSETLRADEVYYDVNRNVAVAVGADLELRQAGVPDPVHLRADELEKLSATDYRARRGEFFSSRLPSDPGLKIVFAQATLEEKKEPRRSLFRRLLGLADDNPNAVAESIVRADEVFLEVESVPIFYLPFIKGDARDPLGPVHSITFGTNRVFGTQIGVGLDTYELLGLDRVEGTRWRTDVDYLSRRGPVLGTTFDFAGKNLFGVPSTYAGMARLWGLHDDGSDILGGGRGEREHHTEWRGRAEFKVNVLDLPYGFSAQAQAVGLSDKNVFEQFFKREFDEDPNKETFVYVKQQQDNWAWTALVEPRLRDWVTETAWLPRADGYWVGQSFFDLVSYNAHASAGYARLTPTHVPPPAYLPTDARTDTGRFDLMQEASIPFDLGPVRVVPYGVLDLTYYTRDRTGNDNGRVYGGGGVRASIPFSRLYPDVHSLLFNVSGINHKIVASANAYVADATDRYTRFPQLDRLNDDATDQAVRDIRPLLPILNPAHGLALTTSPIFDPQLYAIRRLLDTKTDTLDRIEVVQLDLRQRWQTKRGFPGNQHIVDWMTLDLSASLFPRKDRDNFGETAAFLEYDWEWNVGDRTALYSTGWVDPVAGGPRVFTVGAALNRTDRTSFSVGYRQIDPVGSQAVSAAVTYVFSPKYAITGSTLYDFGTNQSLANSLMLTRVGSDLQVTLGLTYNALQQSFGFTFEILPNLVPPGRRIPGAGLAPGLFGR